LPLFDDKKEGVSVKQQQLAALANSANEDSL
jgi:hypothetical protein